MNPRRAFIPQRRAIFIGCEGASEVGYASLLQDLVIAAGLHVHLEISELAPGAGDPLARVEMAVRRLNNLRRTRVAPAEGFVLLDSDQAERNPQRAAGAQHLAQDNDIHIVWQSPCFEAVLLRHMPDRAANRPLGALEAARALNREWPEYQKPMSRAALARKIDLDAILRAAQVEPKLAELLRCLGLMGAQN